MSTETRRVDIESGMLDIDYLCYNNEIIEENISTNFFEIQSCMSTARSIMIQTEVLGCDDRFFRKGS